MDNRRTPRASLRTRLSFALFLLACLIFAPHAQAQTGGNDNKASATVETGMPPPAAQAGEEKAEQIIKRAIEAMGGENYLKVQNTIGRGYFTQYKEGVSGLPLTFVDYIVYPDRERTEFKGTGVKVIQTNTGSTGWLYDGQAKTIQEMTSEQVEDFRFAIRTNIDYLLRGYWRKEGAKLSYVGRREAGLAKRNETIRLMYTDGLTVEFEFGARDGLPSKVLYKRKNKEGEETDEEDRFAQFVTVSGVTLPFVIDHFRTGQQTSRINYDSVEINRPIGDALFTRPATQVAVLF